MSPDRPVGHQRKDVRAQADALAADARTRLLATGSIATVRELAAGNNRTPDRTRRWINKEAAAGRLVALRVPGRALGIPKFQLDGNLALDDRIAVRTSRLAQAGMDPWAIWDWWLTPNAWLDGAAPADAAEHDDFVTIDQALDGLLQ